MKAKKSALPENINKSKCSDPKNVHTPPSKPIKGAPQFCVKLMAPQQWVTLAISVLGLWSEFDHKPAWSSFAHFPLWL